MKDSTLQISDLDLLEPLSANEQAPIQGGWGWYWWGGSGSLTIDEVKTDEHPENGKKTRSWTVQWHADHEPKDNYDRSWTVTYTTDHSKNSRSYWWGW